jgi:hypothetical protein
MTAGEQGATNPGLERSRQWARWALARSAGFPVGQEPRPLVLVGPAANPEAGFRSVPAKLAFLHGDIESAVPLPAGLLEVLGAGAARQEARPGPHRDGGRLLITGAIRHHAAFATDRGRRSLPAWRLTGPDLVGPLWVLDPAIAATRWVPPQGGPPPFQGAPHRAEPATLADDGMTLRFRFIGGPREYVEYPPAEVFSSDHAVVLLPVEYDTGPSGPRNAIGYSREVAVTLDRPLGRRLLVDLDGTPVMVQAHQSRNREGPMAP